MVGIINVTKVVYMVTSPITPDTGFQVWVQAVDILAVGHVVVELLLRVEWLE